MSILRTSSAAELLVALRRDDDAPLHQQLESQLREAIRERRLKAGAPLPSSRTLAADLDVARGVVVEAYEQLLAEGYLSTRPGGATYVATTDSANEPGGSRTTTPSQPAHRIDFRSGRPDVAQFPRTLWLRSIRRVLNETPNERLSYMDGRGIPELREVLAAYLDRVRGTCARPENLVLTTGFAQGFALVARVLRARGARRLAIEDPSLEESAVVAREVGLEVVPIPVDDGGIRVDELEPSGADAVLVTPAHQFPTGAVMPAERRSELVRWACAPNRLIIEDDYDAEYRYDRTPLGAIQGLCPKRVVYAGSASKTLAPGLRLGWVLAPASLVDTIADAKHAADRGSPAIDQLAFADFLSRGEFDRHLRRMRPIYRRRRDALLSALGRHLPGLRPVGASAGLHVIAWLPEGLDETRVVEAAAARGVGVYGLASKRHRRKDLPGGLLFGYATLTEQAIEEGIRELAAAIDSLAPEAAAKSRPKAVAVAAGA